jgi:hypothetical protein
MWNKSAFILVVLIAILLTPGLASGQGQQKLASLEIELWPEYDRPEVLVIYRIGLPMNVSLPAALEIRIPASAGAPNAVAAKQPDGSLITIPYDTQTDGTWNVLSFTATTPETQLEYYDPGMIKEGSNRQFTYNWPGDYATDKLTVQVQQPFDATEMSISPDMGPAERGQDGLNYYTGDFGALEAGQTFKSTITYNKSSDTLTSTNLPVDSISPIDDSAQGRSRLMSSLPWIFGILGMVLLVAGGLWYWQSGGMRAEQTRRPRHKPANQRQATSAPTSTTGQDNIYCHHCGKRAGPGDKFCRGCGTQLRSG